MNWIERVKGSILPRSKEQHDVVVALREWFYTGDTYDLEEPAADCELCGHQDIRYQFTIRNTNTQKELLIGSECITRFEIPAIDETGRRLTTNETRTIVHRDRQKLVTDAKKRRMTHALIELGRKLPDFPTPSFIDYVHDRGAFTPSQLSLLIWRLTSNNVPFVATDFKLTIRRDREKQQLLNLKDFQIRQIWPCLSSAQKDFYQRSRG